MNSRNILPPIVLGVALILAIYLLDTRRLGALGILLVLGLTVIVQRGNNKAKVARSRNSARRDFAWRPVVLITLRSLLSFAAAIAWAAAVAIPIREKWLPDNNWTVFGLLLPPFLGLFILGIFLLFKAISRAESGSRK
jgi:hypothetical protein